MNFADHVEIFDFSRLFLETYKIVVGFLNACFEASDSNDKKDVFKCGAKGLLAN